MYTYMCIYIYIYIYVYTHTYTYLTVCCRFIVQCQEPTLGLLGKGTRETPVKEARICHANKRCAAQNISFR